MGSDVVEDFEDFSNGWVTLKNGKRALIVTDGDSSILKVPVDQLFTISNGDPTTLADLAVVDAYTIRVADPANYSIGDIVAINNPIATYIGHVLIVVGDVITLDSPMNFAYPVGAPVESRSHHMTVDGSVTPVKFETYLPTGTIISQINVSRILMQCLTTDSVDLSKFGDIVGGLTRGLLLRIISTEFETANVWNVKTNGEFALLSLDLNIQSAQNPNQGQNGFLVRYSWGGDDKHGMIYPVHIGDKIEIIVQDDLTALLDLDAVYEGNLLMTGAV